MIKNNKNKIYYTLYLSSILILSIKADTEITEDFDYIDKLNNTIDLEKYNKNLYQKALEQNKNIDFILEKLGQAINSNAIRVKRKDAAKKYISDTRKLLSSIVREKITLFENQNYSALVELNKILIENLKNNIKNNFKNIEVIKLPEFLNKVEIKSIKFSNTLFNKKLNENYDQLNTICENFKNIGLNKINILVRETENFIKNKIYTQKIKKITNRSLPYLGLFSYLLYINRKSTVQKIPVLGKFLGWIKDKIGTAPVIIKERAVENAKNPNQDEVKDRNRFESGFVSNIHNVFNDIIKIDTAPIVTLSMATIIGPRIKEDFKDFSKWSSEKFEDLISILKGENLKDRNKVKKYDNNIEYVANSLYTSKFEELLNYFKNKPLYNLVNKKTKCLYLLSGPDYIFEEITKAIAGQITDILSKKNKNDFCGIYTLYASDILNNESSIITNIENESKYCIITLPDLDWIHEYSNKPEIWAALSNLFRKVKNKNGNLIIFANITNKDLLSKSKKYFEEFIELQNNLSISEIKEFLINEFNQRCLNLNNFNLDDLANKLQKYNFVEIKDILNSAFINAYNNKKAVTQEDIELLMNNN